MRVVMNALRNLWRRYRAQPRPRRELILLGAALLFAITLLPVVIWLVGQHFLGEYVRSPTGAPTGGPLALLIDFLGGVLSGSPGYWLALLGPYLLINALRLGRYVIKM